MMLPRCARPLMLLTAALLVARPLHAQTSLSVSSETQLRDAIFQASNDYAVDGVVNGGPYTITITANITLTMPLPMIRTDMPGGGGPGITIEGSSPSIEICGGDLFRAFVVERGRVLIRNLQIQNVHARGGNGGNGLGGGGGGLGAGAAILVYDGADVTLENVAVTNASATGGNGGDANLPSAHNVGGGGGGGLGGRGGAGSIDSAGAGGGGGYAGNGGAGVITGSGGGGGEFGNGGNAGGAPGGAGGGGGQRGNGGNTSGSAAGGAGGGGATADGGSTSILTGAGGGGAEGGSGGTRFGAENGTNAPAALGGGGGGATEGAGGTGGASGGGGGAGSQANLPGGAGGVGGGGGGAGNVNGGAGGTFGGGGASGNNIAGTGGTGGFGGGGGGGSTNGGTGGNGGVGGGGGGGDRNFGVGGLFGGNGAETTGFGSVLRGGPGGGGAALGGAVFVATGGSLTIDDSTFSGTFSLTPGAAGTNGFDTNGAAPGQAHGALGFLMDGTTTTVHVSSGSSLINSEIAGGGGLTKTGAGTLILTGDHTYTGTTAINEGLFAGEGSLAGPIVVNNGGLLSPGGDFLPTLNSGNLTVNAGGGMQSLFTDVFGTTMYWQLRVTGSVTLNGTLTLLNPGGPTTTPPPGQTFILIDNDGSDAVTGTFTGLPEGATFPLGTGIARITYHGGDGNDVMIGMVASPALSGIASAAVAFGNAIHDTATLAGGASPTGTITFALYAPGDATCSGTPVFIETKPLAGSGASSSNVTPAAAGVYRWVATYGGDFINSAAANACNGPNQTVTITKADQTVTIDPIPSKTFGDAAFPVSAQATSGLTAFTFLSTSSGVCTVASGMVTIVGAGICSLTADQPGDGNYNDAVQTATVVIGKASLAVKADDTTVTYPAAPTHTATLSGFVYGDTAAVVSGAPSFATNATMSAGVPNAGTWTITPAAGTLSAANYTFTFATGTLTVNKTMLTVTADDKTTTYPAALPTLTAATSGFVNGDTAAVVSGAPVLTTNATMSAGVPDAGAWTITPAAGTLSAANYTFTFATGTLTVNKGSQTITFAPLADRVIDAGPFTIDASSSSTLPVTLMSQASAVCSLTGGTTVNTLALGTCTIVARQDGNANYNAAAPVPRSFQVLPNCAIVAIQPGLLTAGLAGAGYSQAFSIVNGASPATFTLTGALPAGLTFANGVISGTASGKGVYPITVTATDANACQVSVSYLLPISPERRFIAGQGGGGSTVRAITPAGVVAMQFDAYGTFAGGASVAQGDVNGDGVADIITGAGPTGGPHVKVFDGNTGTTLGSFFAFDAGFSGGVEVAAGDVTGDGIAEVIVTGGCASPFVARAFNGASGALVREYSAGNPAWSCGLHVAAGDVTGDGIADIVLGSGGAGSPFVAVLDGASGATVRQFLAYSAGFSGGVYVAAGDLTGDGIADIVTGAGAGGGPHVKAFDGVTGSPIAGPLASFFAYSPGFSGGVRVAAGDLNGDDRAELITAAGPGGGPHVRVFNGATGAEMLGVFAFDPSSTAGVFVGAPVPMARMAIAVLPGATASSIRVTGWALKQIGIDTVGTDAIHAWAYPVGGGVPIFVGAALDRVARSDVANFFGGEFLMSGFDFTGTLAPGTYDLVVFARNSRTLVFDQLRIVRVTVN